MSPIKETTSKVSFSACRLCQGCTISSEYIPGAVYTHLRLTFLELRFLAATSMRIEIKSQNLEFERTVTSDFVIYEMVTDSCAVRRMLLLAFSVIYDFVTSLKLYTIHTYISKVVQIHLYWM